MPQLNRKEHGSILVAVVGISALLSTAVVSFIGLSGRGSDAGTEAVWRQKTFLAAESGLHLGLRYLRDIQTAKLKPPTATPGSTWGIGEILTQSSTIAGTKGWMDLDGIQVKVMLEYIGGALDRQVISYATRGAGSDTVKLTIEVDAQNGSGAPFQTNVNTDDWKIAILP